MAVVNEYLRGQLEALSGFWVSSSDAEGAPDLVRTMGVRVEPDGEHLVTFVPVPYAGNLIAQLAPGEKLALLQVNVNTYVSWQFKGHCVSHRPSTADEVAFQRRYVEDFCREIEKQGMAWETTFPVLFRQPSITLRMRAAEVYEQTPKAGTGERMFF
ncbi:MAG TPA: hypothetical protein VF646_06680 [Cytophagales bacterium]|jgi:hypothetical protein